MKMIECEKIIKLLELMKDFLPGQEGTLPSKFLIKENIDQIKQAVLDHAVDDDTLVCKAKMLSPDEIFKLWRERYLDERDPVMNIIFCDEQSEMLKALSDTKGENT